MQENREWLPSVIASVGLLREDPRQASSPSHLGRGWGLGNLKHPQRARQVKESITLPYEGFSPSIHPDFFALCTSG